MRIDLRFDRTSVLSTLYAIVGFLALNPYFVWNDYTGLFGVGHYLPRLFELLLFFAFFIGGIPKRKCYYQQLLFCGCLILLFQFAMMIQSTASISMINVYSRFSKYLAFAIFLIVREDVQIKSFYKFLNLYIISLLPGLLVVFFNYIGITLPYTIIRSTENFQTYTSTFYRLYLGTVFRSITYMIEINQWRLCGMLNEPGMVGTFSAFFFIITAHFIKKRKMLWLNLIGGVLSLSLAFVLMTIIGLSLRYLRRNKLRIISVIVVLLLGYNIFMNIDFTNPQLFNLQQRLVFSEGVLKGDNRENDSYKNEFEDFINSGNIRNICFGLGEGSSTNNPNMVGSFSYKSLIYDFGIFGFVFIITWLFACSFYTSNKLLFANWNILSIFIVFILSIYQRPIVLDSAYIITLIGGISYINKTQNQDCYS